MIAIITLPLLWLILSDSLYRRIDTIPLLLFGALQLYYGDIYIAMINSIVVTLLILFLSFYVKIRWNRSSTLRDYFGEGDVLFLYTLAPMFDIYSFIVFVTVSFTMSAIYGYIVERKSSVPLIATIGLCYIIYLTYINPTYEIFITSIAAYLVFNRFKCAENYTAPNSGLFGNDRFNI